MVPAAPTRSRPARTISATDSPHFRRIAAAAEACGVTRLADITRLDRIGLPVWQAVRPAGLSLSVHQGKGTNPLAAQIGALCEAIESHRAERAPADGPTCTWDRLATNERAPDPTDFARGPRAAFPGRLESWRWCRATDLASGADVFVPHDLVSLDFTRGLPSPVERSSNGLGAGNDESEAVLKGLCELIERDAVGAWLCADLLDRLDAALDADSIPFEWFGHWRRRLATLESLLIVFAPPAVVAVPTFICWISGPREFGAGLETFAGTAAHPDPERALFGAFAEAVQSRLTWIAAVRDDFLPGHYANPGKLAPMPLVPPGWEQHDWSEVAPGPATAGALIERLTQAGFPQVAAKRLDDGVDGVAVVKMFVPGLGTKTRERRNGATSTPFP